LNAPETINRENPERNNRMQSLIVYSSQTGNTRKMAEAACEMLHGETVLHSVQEAPDPKGYDLVVVCFWLQAGKPDPKSQAFLRTLEGADLFLIATHGAASDSAHAKNAVVYAQDLAPSATLMGTFSCQGEVNPDFLERASQKNPQPPWIADAPAAVGHPDAEDLARLKKAMAISLPAFVN
jgi:sulfite reductase alpha subunit-like flavoprotein